MSAGQKFVVGPTAIANNNYLTIQPVAGVEATIHNIHSSGASELSIYDGTNEIRIDASSTEIWWSNLTESITNGVYLRVKNVSGSSVLMHASGVVTAQA